VREVAARLWVKNTSSASDDSPIRFKRRKRR
jgi:hypothetical protein